MTISAWWLRTSSKFSGKKSKETTGKMEMDNSQAVQIRAKHSATVALLPLSMRTCYVFGKGALRQLFLFDFCFIPFLSSLTSRHEKATMVQYFERTVPTWECPFFVDLNVFLIKFAAYLKPVATKQR